MKTIAQMKSENYGFITDKDIPVIVQEDRFQKVLVRCGCGRFTCAVQDVEHFISIIERDGKDYVRDVALIS
jgi:hypothetical protein